MQMSQSKSQSQMQGSSFSFGQVEDTFYQEYKLQGQQSKLPYNPFLFDLSLILIKSEQGYQKPDIEIQLKNNVINTFGRKPKKRLDLLADQQPLTYQFLAPTVSKKHFAITPQHYLQDLGSKKGTYIWIHRHQPKLLQIGDEFLLNEATFNIHNINKQTQKIQIQIDTKLITLNPKGFKDKMFIIGSHPKCHFVFSGLKQFHAGIDLHSLNLFNLIQDEDCQNNVGTWMRVKDQVKVQGGDIFLVFPYVFKIKY